MTGLLPSAAEEKQQQSSAAKEAEAEPLSTRGDAAAALPELSPAATLTTRRSVLPASLSSPQLASLASVLPTATSNFSSPSSASAPSLSSSSSSPAEPPSSSSSSSSWSSLSSFVLSEVVSVDSSGSSSHPSSSPRALVYNFLILPYFLERLLSSGFLICLDCFLFLFTMLPLRMLLLALRLLRFPVQCLLSPSRAVSSLSSALSSALPDVVRFVLLLLSWYCLSQLPMSRLYHYIRGQSVLKLYVIFNMLQISDRLLASIGEDVLDALFSSLHLRLPLPQLAFHFSLSSLYLLLHSLLLFTQCITLNVSVNSDNSSLFLVLVSNNFVELKSAVFKRFDGHSLFQAACSDVVERFQLSLFLLVIVVMNVSHLGLRAAVELEWVERAVLMVGMVLAAECGVDWLKHGFICKFNLISPRVYRQFADILYHDFITQHFTPPQHQLSQQQQQRADRAAPGRPERRLRAGHSVSRRLGLSSLPLAVLVLRVFGQAFMRSSSPASAAAAPAVSFPLLPVSLPLSLSAETMLKLLVLALLLCVLMALKLLLTISLLGRVAEQARHDGQQQLQQAQTGDAAPLLETAKDAAEVLPAEVAAVKLKKEEEAESATRSRLEALSINTQLAHPHRPHADVVMPPLEAQPPASASGTGLLLSVETAAYASLSGSPSGSPTSSSSSSTLSLPVMHEGDALPAHDRVGSVELLGPSSELFTDLLSIDRFQLHSQPPAGAQSRQPARAETQLL